jgi:hypothetical protein
MNRQLAGLLKAVGTHMDDAPKGSSPQDGNPPFGQQPSLASVERMALTSGSIDEDTVYALPN